MKSILLVRRAYGLGGAELYNLNLALELRQLGYNPIICTQQPELRALAAKHKIKLINPLWLNNRGSLTAKFTLKVWIEYGLAAPIILAQYLYCLIRYNVRALYIQTRDDQIFGTLAATILGRRSIWADHGDLKIVLTTKDPHFQRIYRWAMAKSKGVVCVADSERRLISSHLPAELREKLMVIHNGVSRTSFGADPSDSPDGDFIIGSTARVQTQKGVDILVEAFAQALPKLPPKSLLRLVGAIDHDSIVELAKSRVIADQVSFFGPLPNDKIAAFLKELDVYIFPSRGEVFPLSVLEAMMSSRPVIATKVGGIPELIEDNKDGILVTDGDIDALATAMIQLANDPSLRHRLAKAAGQKAQHDYNFSQIVKDRILPLLIGDPQ